MVGLTRITEWSHQISGLARENLGRVRGQLDGAFVVDVEKLVRVMIIRIRAHLHHP